MNTIKRLSIACFAIIVFACTLSAQPDFTKAAESTVNGVVSVKTYATPRGYGNYNDFYNDPFFEYFFGSPRKGQQEEKKSEQEQLGLGSGVIISKDGYIVTNNHVIEGAERIEIVLNDNRSFNARVVGTDPNTDLALLKIEAENLHVIPMGNSDNLKIGEWVLAVGNPYSLTSTVTAGIVSAKARNISQIFQGRSMGIESYIQTDAVVNQGNSGGALVNLKGELVGINTAMYSRTGSYAGYSLAIPVSIVEKVVSDIKEYGTVQRAMLGVGFKELTASLAEEKGITATTSGIYVARVENRSAAMEGGIEVGDVIIAINNVPTLNTAQMQEQMNKFRPGDKVTITYIRNNKKHNTSVTLRNSEGGTKLTKTGSFSDLGCAFKEVSAETLRQLELRNGVQVAKVKDGKFKDAGIKDGFIITDINNYSITSVEDIETIYNRTIKDSDKVMFITGVYPTGKKVYYAVDLSDE